MPEYTRENTLRIAKRFHNRKRTYLLVNPLQAKHIPVSPTRALEMMDALGDRTAVSHRPAGHRLCRDCYCHRGRGGPADLP